MRHADQPSPRAAAALALLSVLLTGCPSLLTMGPARTVPRGSTQEWIALGAYRTVLVSRSTSGDERSTEWMPLVDAGARYGLTDRIDLGVRAGLGGLSVGPRFQLLRSPSTDTGVDLLLEPSVGVTGALPTERGGIVTGVYGALALPLGLNLGRGSQLVLTPRLALVADDVLGHYAMPGGSAALVFRVGGGDDRPWFLIPECGTAAVRGSFRAFDGPILQCALGLAGPW
jgi:hypothetical protein